MAHAVPAALLVITRPQKEQNRSRRNQEGKLLADCPEQLRLGDKEDWPSFCPVRQFRYKVGGQASAPQVARSSFVCGTPEFWSLSDEC